jgi:hypothetical protein
MNGRKFLSMMIIAASLFAVSLNAQEKSRPYDYPVKPGTQEWKALASHEQKRQVCQIPQSILSSMSTPDLLETCLNYPLYGDMMAYDRVQDGFEYVEKGFNGLQELLNRYDVGAALIERYGKMDPDAIDSTWTSVKKGEYSLKFFSIEILLAQEEVIANLSKNDRIKLLKESHKKIIAKQQHPEIYGLMGLTNNALLMGRIILKERYAPFVKLISRDSRLNEILQNAVPISKDYISEIIKHAERYLEQ